MKTSPQMSQKGLSPRVRGKYGSLGNFFKAGLRGGFSLVEVTIAIGIVSFALLSLLGLLPMGLIVLRDAADQTACAHIVQKVRGDLTHLSSEEVQNYVTEKKYFNFEGRETNKTDAIFETSFQRLSLRYPGSAGINDALNSDQVLVTIRRSPGGLEARGGGQGDRAQILFRATLSLANTR